MQELGKRELEQGKCKNWEKENWSKEEELEQAQCGVNLLSGSLKSTAFWFLLISTSSSITQYVESPLPLVHYLEQFLALAETEKSLQQQQFGVPRDQCVHILATIIMAHHSTQLRVRARAEARTEGRASGKENTLLFPLWSASQRILRLPRMRDGEGKRHREKERRRTDTEMRKAIVK
uniref:Uncharacterized protein n=1 Tax=Pristionchus pacificus TaxID=54126 RepID=A0A2A6C1M0_PRIPA|eukprot:PDM72026.1 hypothetical protein PRIPAC_38433 [Pristionchus pacificus]